MRKFIFFFLLVFGGVLAQAGVHRCGTYNIRVAGAQADTGERDWVSRREALVSVLRDSMRFDVVGLNEVRNNDSPYDQLNYLKQQLGSTYTFVCNSSYIKNQVLYRTDKYTLLDKGTFYLSSNPSKASKSWDDTEVHLTVWVKLQDKESGEIFVFGSTHMSLYPVSQREGARINAEQMNQIAGDYPCIVTGDMNVEPNEHNPLANFGKLMGNARQMCKTEPQGKYGTYIPGMNPNSNDAKLLDYLFVRNLEIESYFVYSKATEGRTLAPSDHQPVVAEVKLLSPNREFVHRVSNVAELREVCHDMQPNDIVVMEDGTYDLGDSALYVANTCVIEGKDAVLTGNTQLFELADYISLELRDLTIRGARCTTGAKGSIMHAHGAYLKMENCVVEQCSAAGEGLIYSEDCETILNRCLFRENENEDQDGGVHITSAVGCALYPLTMTNCRFLNNNAYYGTALYYNGEGDVYLYGNSFVGNQSEEKGAVVLYSPNSVKDIRLVNNTFVDNRIDVMAGFMSEGIGGSAIWQELSAKGKMTLMNNTIVGNYTACMEDDTTSSTTFPSGAVCSYAGQLALYNNVLAGNYSSKPGCGDLAMTDVYELKGIAHNVFSSKDNLAIIPSKTDFYTTDFQAACEQLKLLYEGWQEANGAYHPRMQYYGEQQMPALSPLTTTYAGQSMEVLDMDAMSAAMLESDILNRGSNTGYLAVDQTGYVRKNPSVPGSMEAGQAEPSGWENVNGNGNVNVNVNGKAVINNRLVIIHDGKMYDAQGACL